MEQVREVEFDTRTVGPMVLTTPVLRQVGVAQVIDQVCPVAEQAEMGHGVVAEMVIQCRLTEPQALYDMPGWAEKYDLAALYQELEAAGQFNDDRVGRMLDAIYEHRAVIWGEVVGRATAAYEVDLSRLHADTTALRFAGQYAQQGEKEEVPRLEKGYNAAREWVQQLKVFALATGDGGLPVWFDALDGGAGDSPEYVPQFEAFQQHAQLAGQLPLEEVVMLGDRKMATAANQLAWNRLGIGYIGPLTMQEHHRETLRELLAGGQRWQELPYVAGRDEGKPVEDRTVYRGLGHTVELEDQEQATSYEVRHLYVHSSTLAQRDRQRREKEMAAIEEELQRIQRLVNKYDYTRPEMIVRRVQSKAFKKRRAQRYFDIQVVEHAQPPEAPLELRYQIKAQEMAQEAELDGVYLLVAGGPAAALADGQILPQWKGQYKVEHCFGLMNQLFLVAPIFLKTPQRIVSLVLLIMIGCLVAGLIQRQVRRAVAEHQEPIRGLMPEGRDTLKPTVTRILKAFAHYGLVQMRDAQGQVVARRWGRLNAVQQQILDRLGLPHPAEVFGHRRLA